MGAPRLRASGSSPAAQAQAGISSRQGLPAEPRATLPVPPARCLRTSSHPPPQRRRWNAVGTRERVGVGENVRTAYLVVQKIEAELGLRLRLHIELPLKGSDLIRRFQAHRQSPLLPVFESTSEARGLSSAGVTRPQRSYAPLRLPRRAGAPIDAVEARSSLPRGSPPIARSSLPACRAQYPGGPDRRACRCLPCPYWRPRHRG